MKKIIDTIKTFFDGKPLLWGALMTTLKTFVIAGGAAALIFLLLWVTKIYPKLGTALDLKYNAPWVLVPMCIFAALFLVCLMVGFLMYFHKYKRSKTKTAFYQALAPVWSEE